MTTPLTAVKLRNQFLKLDPTLSVELKNIRVNGSLFGCSGFISDGTRWVYVNTDHNHHTRRDALYRTASGPRDYTGGPNHFVNYEHLAEEAIRLLMSVTHRS